MAERHFVFGSTDRRTLNASFTDATNRDRVFADDSHSHEPASARGVLADENAAETAADPYGEHVTPSSYVPFQTSFLGQPRHVLRHVAHEEEADDGRDAGRRDDPSTHVRRSDAHEYFDVYEQLGYAPMYQDPQTLAEFAADLKNPRFLDTVTANIRESSAPAAPVPPSATPAARLARADKLRADIARAMMSRQGASDVLSLDYLRLVPAEYVDNFCALREVQAIVGTLVPLLYLPASLREHWTMRALNDILGGAGCTYFSSRSLELTVHDARRPFAGYTGDAGNYGDDDDDSTHTHMTLDKGSSSSSSSSSGTGRLPLLVVTYLCTSIPISSDASKEAAAAAAATVSSAPASSVSDTLAASAQPLGSTGTERTSLTDDATERRLMYLLDVVAHRVEPARLCFRTFAFRSELLLTTDIRAIML